ncbi:hypothetical protein PMIN02_007767 [Paraphaeosphaeria minitans]
MDNGPLCHITLGQAKTDAQQTRIHRGLRARVAKHSPDSETKELRWRVDTAYVIERKGFKGRFNIVGSIKLGED